MVSASIPTVNTFKLSSLPACFSESVSKTSEQLTAFASIPTNASELSSLPTCSSSFVSKVPEQLS